MENNLFSVQPVFRKLLTETNMNVKKTNQQEKTQNKTIFGIDLGTTYCCIAYVNQDGFPIVVPNIEGDNTTPSVVQFNGEERIVGKEAKDSIMLEPDNTVDMIAKGAAVYGQKLMLEQQIKALSLVFE
ncbi:Hsp70 family protein [Crocosphaera watsonii]|uniref:Chaperone protein DnaK n=1 Tax=Crocosphaera watsonii WH 0401 TaxID=555881 RepID=T2JF07_CROWT|nr:Hsp70 family protein [Crocosphaera watsonii]CCQ63062.1 Chaperone protein DnaK [Crocosphaera watsonii WH 0401]